MSRNIKHLKKIFTACIWAIILSCISFGLILWLWTFSLVSNISENINDTLTYRLQYPSNSHNNDVVIVKIDDTSLDSIGKSDLWMLAFDKWTYARAIENLFEIYNAWVIGIDIVFANPSVLWAADEQKLQQVLGDNAQRVVIATRSDYTPHPLCLYSNVSHGIININQAQKIRSVALEYPDYNISLYCSDTSVIPENTNGAYIFAGEILKKYTSIISPLEGNLIEKWFKKFEEISNNTGKIFIEYFHGGWDYEGTLWYESYSFSDILAWNLQDSAGNPINLENKIVLIWEVWTIMHDSHFTPISRTVKMPGVEINANIVSTLLKWSPLIEGNITTTFYVYLLINIILILSVFYFRFVVATWVFVVSILIGIIYGAWMFYLGEIINIFLIVSSLFLSYVVAYIYRFQVTDRSKRNLKKSFSLYVSPDVVHEIAQNPQSVSTSWQRREMSIFFSDIAWFTSISESTKPEVLLELLNEYFSNMTWILLKNKGTLDKYIWDAVMWFFNAPVFQENHSYYACLTAVEQQKKLTELNNDWKEKWYPHIAIRIWIHTWEAIHGNIGSLDTRLNYTVIWDSVNLASRLEAIGKRYGIYTCVSEDVYNLQKEKFNFRELDKITVKWKKIPVTIYELISVKWDPTYTSYTAELIKKYEQALHLYYEEKYSEAIAILKAQLDDTASEKLLERCENVLSWKIKIHQGVFEMTEK